MTDNHHRKISRRDFIKLAAATGLLAGCSPVGVADVTSKPPTTTPLPTEPPLPTPTAAPTVVVADPGEIARAAAGLGTVVQTHHAGVWNGDTLSPEALQQMLDASITELTGLNDAVEAWASLFMPDERVAIKVNAVRGGITHPALVLAVADRLQAAGLPAEQIVIFDRNTAELADAGYEINQDGPGVRCYGSGEDWGKAGNYSGRWSLIDDNIKMSDILLACDALINIPVLKTAVGPGLSFGLKNHYGTFDIPSRFHGHLFRRGIAELNALPPIKDRTRLTIGDVLTTESSVGGLDRYRMVAGDSRILMSFDPVAHDAVGLQLGEADLTAAGFNPKTILTQATYWLETGTEIGLGVGNVEEIEVREVNLV
jgi:uncharacterized protein (DUF362 family)